MPETKEIPVITSLTRDGNDLVIKTEYFPDELPDTIEAIIALTPGIENSVAYEEGDLRINMVNHPEFIDYEINGEGELIVISERGDASNYSIDSNGDLIYTY